MEDKIMAYGVFMGKRFKPKQKERFINGLGNEFAQMGYTVRLMNVKATAAEGADITIDGNDTILAPKAAKMVVTL